MRSLSASIWRKNEENFWPFTAVLKPGISGHTTAITMPKQSGGHEMRLSRRTLLRGAAALPLAGGNFGLPAFAQTPPPAPTAGAMPPVPMIATRILDICGRITDRADVSAQRFTPPL